MKRSKSPKVATALAILGAAVGLAGCGKSNDSVPPHVGGIPGPQYPGAGGCVPLATSYGGGTQPQLGFQAMNMYFDGRKIEAGYIPGYSQPRGQVTVTAGGSGGPYTRSGVDGTISMNITQMPGAYGTYPTGYPTGSYPTYPTYGGTTGTATTANANGFIQISQATLSDILMKFGGGYTGGTYSPYPTYPTYPTYPGTMPMPQPYQPTTCVSGIALDLQWSPSAGMLYGGWVYLYLNNTQHGYKLYF